MPTIMCRIAWHTIDNYPHCWNKHNQIDGGAFAFSSSPRLITLYTSCKRGQNWGVTLLLYVDDLFVTGMDGLIVDMKRKLSAEFKMKDLGMMHYFLGMEVWQNVDGIFLGQWKYAVDILKRFRMMECKAMTTPMAVNLKLLSVASSESVDSMMYRQMIFSLMYLTNTRPDICFAVNTLR